jgi:hypothetical protein
MLKQKQNKNNTYKFFQFYDRQVKTNVLNIQLNFYMLKMWTPST